ncbi:MAG: sulfite exporter TauE/SafE family protein [Peptococcaceae bacterium]
MVIVLIGLLMGILSGLAIGGGTLLVPALIYIIGTEQHIAQGVSLAAFIPTAIVAVYTHHKQGNVKFKLAMYLAAGSVVGAILGASIANNLNALLLKKIFGFFLIGMGIYEYACKSKLQKLQENKEGPAGIKPTSPVQVVPLHKPLAEKNRKK